MIDYNDSQNPDQALKALESLQDGASRICTDAADCLDEMVLGFRVESFRLSDSAIFLQNGFIN